MPKRTSSKTLAGPRASAKTASHTTTNKANSNTNINTISELRELSILLTALRTRNKNQHRRSVWWAHFEQFRKFVIRLVDQSTAGNGETPVQTLETVRTKKVGKWHRYVLPLPSFFSISIDRCTVLCFPFSARRTLAHEPAMRFLACVVKDLVLTC